MAAFGITHGIYAWTELFLLLQEPVLDQSEYFIIYGIIVLLLIISFLMLTQFGLVLIFHVIHDRRIKFLPVFIFIILFTLWVISIWRELSFESSDFLSAAYLSGRNIFGMFGSMLTAYGLWAHSKELKSISITVANKFLSAAIVFVFYGISAGIIPSHTQIPYVHFPVEGFRALCVVLITYFILNAVSRFDLEIKRKLEKQLMRYEQSEKLISIGRLAAGIAHEINNPLANASLNIEILKKRLADINNPEIMTRLDKMEINISKAAIIARELLQFSRHTKPELIDVDMNALIKSSITLMEHKFKGMSVRTNLSDNLAVMGDPVKLEQVMINILDNAHQAMKHGDQVRIESSVHDGVVKIIVADSGKGIANESLSKVFDPFFTTKEVGVGTGLGLSICYGIIDQHGGDIEIESTEGAGTTVTITLPAHQ